MKHYPRRRFWVETGLAMVSAALAIITWAWSDWIEIVFRFDPDAGSGAVEWAIVAIAVCATVVFSALARSEWRRAAAQPAPFTAAR
jgi:hypothetical protein